VRVSKTTTVTIRDVANRAGVSIGTVSRALKNQTGLTEETRQQVLRSALELGYDTTNLRPNKLRRVSFLTSRLPDLTINPFYSPVLHGVEDACRDEEIVLSYISLRPGDRAVELVRRHEADGLLCAGYFEPKLIERIAAIGLPLVLIDHFVPGIPSVNMDNINGAKKAVTHLLQAGYKRIAFMGGPNHYSIQQRLYGFRQALFEAGVPADPTLEITPDPPFTLKGTELAMRHLLTLEPRPDAVFVVSDLSALWAMQVCLEAGLRIPEDMSFVGFDDIHAAAHAHPPLTTVQVNKELLGRRGLESLLARHTVDTLVETELIVRDSSVAKDVRKQRKSS
jgi:LacI family transcriptional regulator, repressor for deo operon, udp, cdd, tsx, nupC, and nupG